MPESWLKTAAITIQQTLFATATPEGLVAVYQTAPFGKLLTLNDHIILSEHDSFFYHEMMTHPALFTHPHPKRVIIQGHYAGLLNEVLKHASVTEIYCLSDQVSLEQPIAQHFQAYQTKPDPRVTYITTHIKDWITQAAPATFDILIKSDPASHDGLPHPLHDDHLLRPDGILVQSWPSSLFHAETPSRLSKSLPPLGFTRWQMLNFPQPSHPFGWRTAIMATQNPLFKRIREKDIFNRSFETRYYNFDTHQAALALPEFIRKQVGI